MKSPASQFGIIRHAKTLWNEEKRIQGHQNSPLSTRGKMMAKAWGQQLKALRWDRIITSDLGRTIETADHINAQLNLPVHHHQGLREQDWGQWSGLTIEELYRGQLQEVQQQEKRGWDFLPPQGESRHQVVDRAFQALLESHQRWPGESILVICHEGVIKCLLYQLAGREFLPTEPKILTKGYHLHLLHCQSEIFHLQAINHLPLTN